MTITKIIKHSYPIMGTNIINISYDKKIPESTSNFTKKDIIETLIAILTSGVVIFPIKYALNSYSIINNTAEIVTLECLELEILLECLELEILLMLMSRYDFVKSNNLRSIIFENLKSLKFFLNSIIKTGLLI